MAVFAPDDTIVAIATPAGRGGLGVVRLSGPQAADIGHTLIDRTVPLEPRRATLARVLDRQTPSPTPVDEIVAIWFPQPGSYTGEHVVEISAHGSPVLLERIVELACGAGARMAEPGEFTLRAFLNGRLDLIQAEAVADLVDAVTPLQARVAFDQLEGTITERIAAVDRQLLDLTARVEASLDFPEEGYHFIETDKLGEAIGQIQRQIDTLLAGATRGRLIREGCHVVILGKPNVGKSSLFNQLVGTSRAIVTSVAGTTRDLVTEPVEFDGLAVRLVDSAGIRVAADAVEAEGVSRARQAREVAAATIVVVDRSQALSTEDRVVLEETESGPRVVAVNKIDKPLAWTIETLGPSADVRWINVSALTGAGVAQLKTMVRDTIMGESGQREIPVVANARHIDLLRRAGGSLGAARQAAIEGSAEEFVLHDLSHAREALEELTGRRTPDDVIQHIFERFCIGK